MSITKQRMNQIIKEELTRALKQRGLNEMMDQNYNDDLQSRLGRFTTPENVKGTPQYGRVPSPARKPEPGIYYPQDYTPSVGAGAGNWDYSEYDHLLEADDDMGMDSDMGIDVVPDDEMGGEEDMGMDMGGEDMMAPLEQEIDWSQFQDEDGEVVGAAFLDAIKKLREDNPDEEPTAEAVVAMMQELLAPEEDEEMGDEEMEDEGEIEDEAPMEDAEEEGALNEWVRRTNLLAGTSKRR
jgi:hypothetical protein